MGRDRFSVLILAAGKGTRMKSDLPKVLHPVCEVPMIFRVLKTVSRLNPKSIGVVIGHGGKELMAEISKGHPRRDLNFVWQKIPKGSGHAVQCCSNWIRKALKKGASTVLILCGDAPLVSEETLKNLIRVHREQNNAVTVCSMTVPNPFGYGRMARGGNDRVCKIVEEKDASDEEKMISEVNTGIYCFDAEKLLQVLPKLRNDNAKKEYYLTDTIEHFHKMGYPISCFRLEPDQSYQALGINSPADLALAEKFLQEKILKGWMESGVKILNPDFTYVGEQVKIGPGTLILPGTMILGKTRIGSGCKIGPHATIEDSTISDDVTIRASFVYGSKIAAGVNIGPFSHIRPGSVIESGARVGNFSEIKSSKIGRDTKVSHLAYIGDAVLGDEINVGAGAITCNFDGKNKHKTVIGSKTFVGSNVNLIAPVKIGKRTVIGAGSTITRDVPPESLAIERGQQIVKRGWTKGKID